MSVGFDLLKSHSLAKILDDFENGDRKNYQAVCELLKNSSGLSDAELLNFLAHLRSSVGILSTGMRDLVFLILDMDLLRASEFVIKEHSQLLISLAVGQVTYTEIVLRNLVRRFMPAISLIGEKSIEDVDHDFGDLLQKSYAVVHYTLSSIIGMSPMCQSKLLTILRDSYPFMRRPVVQLRDYVRNLLELSEYAQMIKTGILRLIIDETLRLDTVCSKEAMKLQTKQENDAEVFPMDCDTNDILSKNKAKLEELTNKLDVILCDILEYIKSNRQSSGTLSSMYRQFLEIFDRIILSVHGCNHIQFLWFYICSLHEDICNHFFNWLWSKVRDPCSSDVIRQSAACYLSALLARSEFVSLRHCKAFVLLWVNTMHKYIDNDEGILIRGHLSKHGLFYVLSQATFYVLVARHQEFIETASGYQFLKNLKLDRIITCSLNPLKYCTSSLVYSFASISRSYQFAFCYAVIERNRRTALYEMFDNRSAIASKDHQMHWFFPFESYFLPKYSVYVQDLLRPYPAEAQTISEGNANVEAHSENSANDYEFLLPEDTLSKSLDKFYGSSLGKSPCFSSICGKY